MGDRAGMLPGMNDVADYFIHAGTVTDLRENERAGAAHLAGVAIHDAQVRPYGRSQVGLVDDQQIGLGDAGSAFARNLVAASHVNDINSVIGQFAAEMGGQVVAAGFQQQKLGMKLLLQFLQGQQVGGNILANGGVGATAGFDGAYAIGLQGLVADEEFTVFLGENVIGDGGDVVLRAQTSAASRASG